VDNYLLPVPGKAPFDGVERDISSIFLQTKWEAVDNRLFFIAGARYDSYSDFGDQLTPRTGIIYKPGEKSSIKALYGQAFRAASGNELTSASAVVLGSKDIDPEVIDVYELVYMYRDEGLKLSLNGFYSKWTDGIIRVANPAFVPGSPFGSPERFEYIYANEGKSRSYGAEVSFSCKFDPFGLDLGLSYAKSEALDVNDPIDSTQIIDLEYDVFPEYSLKFGFFYFWEEQDVRFHLNNILYIRMKEYPSTYKTSLRSPDDLPPFWRVDLNICKKVTEKMELTLDIRNLFNRTNNMPSVWGMKDGLEEPGISFLLRVGYTF
jgi:outer membrane receptor protein involved in Fe transport